MDDRPDPLTLEELLLGEGDAAARDALRGDVAADPLRTLELAETVALFEGLRQLEVEPGSRYACKLHDVVRRAERTVPAVPRPGPWRSLGWFAAVAAACYALLWLWDPLDRRAASRTVCALPVEVAPADPAAAGPAAADAPTVDAEGPTLREPEALAWEQAVETMRVRLGLEPSRRLGEAFEEALQASPDPLQCWLDPQNALASLRAEHELRRRPEVRRAALRHQGGLVDADRRVQELTERLTGDLRLLHGGLVQADLRGVALAVRALIAAGSVDAGRADALAAGSEWLAARIDGCTDARLVTALVPLVEVAAVRGGYVDLVARHGRRLVDEVLRADADTWGRRRPELLDGKVAAATIGDAARLLRLLPGFGVDASRCHIVRQLLLGSLRERRDAGDDGPELLAAMLYGCADLLSAADRAFVERQLRRWTPLRLAPDFVTVQQLAWGFEPGRVGFARLQLELRRLAVLSDPGGLAPRAAYCLCLATNYAAWPGSDYAALVAGD